MSREPTGVPVLRYAAFTHHGAGGNPAGVVLDAHGLDGDACLAIAKAVNYSETAFVTPATEVMEADVDATSPREFDVRYFSPLAPVAFCGHATIAAAVALADRDGVGSLVFNTLAGPITVDTVHSPGGISATMASPPTSTHAADPDVVAITPSADGTLELLCANAAGASDEFSLGVGSYLRVEQVLT